MDFLVALRGMSSEKYFNGENRIVIPFVGANEKGSVGIGLIVPEYNGVMDFYGLIFPHRVIQAWRAMKALELHPAVEKETLVSCWQLAAKESLHSRYLLVLSTWFESEEGVINLRNDIRKLVPSDNELDTMVTSLKKNRLKVSMSEIQDEVAAGKLITSPRLQILLSKLTAA